MEDDPDEKTPRRWFLSMPRRKRRKSNEEEQDLKWTSLFATLSRAILRRRFKSTTDCQQITEETMTLNGVDGTRGGPSSFISNAHQSLRDTTQAPSTSASQQAAAQELAHFHSHAVSLLRNNNIYVNFSPPATMVNERRELSKHGWYWGPITMSAAQRKLNGRPNGSFLVRDSQTGPFQFSISFRSGGRTLHTRIEFSHGYWTIFADRRYKTMLDLIEDTMRESKLNILCYVPTSSIGPDFPIQLRLPVSRFVESSLQHLCRLAIRTHLATTHKGGSTQCESLPLPKLLIGYLSEATFDSL